MKWTIWMTAALVALGAAGCSRTLDRAPIGRATPVAERPERSNLTTNGSMYFAGQPDEALLRTLAEEHGVTTVINMRSAEAMREHVAFDEAAAARAAGMEYVHMPLAAAEMTREDVERFGELLARTKGPALLHCASSNNAGGLWAAYLHFERGVPAEEAIEKGREAGLARPATIEAVRALLGAPAAEGR